MLDVGLRALLANDQGLAALIAGRVFPATLPENATLPAMTYMEAGGSRRPTFDTAGMQKIRMQFDLFGAAYGDAANVREALRLLLDGYQGTLAEGTVIQNAELIPGSGRYDSDSRYFRCMVEYYFYFNFNDGPQAPVNGSALMGIVVTASSAAPDFNGAGGNVFPYQLQQDVTSSTTSNLAPGETYIFEITQAAGVPPYSFAWPATMIGASTISPNPGQSTVQTAVCLTGGALLCLGPAVYI